MTGVVTTFAAGFVALGGVLLCGVYPLFADFG